MHRNLQFPQRAHRENEERDAGFHIQHARPPQPPIALPERHGPQPYPVYFPSVGLSTDNAAMIAAAAFPKLARGDFAALDILAQANLTLA